MLSANPAPVESGRIVPPYARAPPRSEEYVTGSSSTASVSACVATDQNPSPPGVCTVGGCQYTGASRRCTTNTSCGNPSAKLSRSVRSTSASRTTRTYGEPQLQVNVAARHARTEGVAGQGIGAPSDYRGANAAT